MATTTSVSPSASQALALEYSALRHKSHCPLGMYVLPSESLFEWNGVLFVHQGYYAGAILRFKLSFKRDYPATVPAVTFITDTFHPLIAQDGKMPLNARFRPWRPTDHHVFDVLHYIKAIFKKDALDRLDEAFAVNTEAHSYRESTSSFAALANQTALLSQRESALFDRDHPSMGLHKSRTGNGIQFVQLDEDTLEGMRKELGLSRWEST